MKVLDALWEAHNERDLVGMLEAAQALVKYLKHKITKTNSARKEIQDLKHRISLAHEVLINSSKEFNLEEVEIRLWEIRNAQEKIDKLEVFVHAE